ncbi:MAG: cytochrome c [Nitrospirales bacterium]
MTHMRNVHFKAPDHALLLMVGILLCLLFPFSLFAAEGQKAESLINTTCSTCHKFQGKGESRFNLKAPDLMWGGSKFQRDWVIGYLTGKEPMLYAKGYRWDQDQQADQHMTVSQEEAEGLADYFETHLQDPRVKPQAIDMTTFSRQEAKFGEEIFTQHSCIGCHQIMVDGKKVGGPQSTSFFNSGKRLKADWIYRFNSNPPDFVPHSGEFVGDVSELGLRYVTGFIATRGNDDFPYHEPWKSSEFDHPNVERGATIYKEYCAQCHGAEGKGDGPAASGLEPKPAVHANLPFDKIPLDYLFNVIYYGGKGVGKSSLMPYWGLTIGGKQGVADVIAYLKATFKGAPEVASAATPSGGPSGVCPQPRKTTQAPGKYRHLTNPLPGSQEHIKAGEKLFHETAQPLACIQCHGAKGDGNGPMGAALNPHPRNFTCGETMKGISDGQLYWIIKNGSPGTGMMAFSGMPDDQIWQLIQYIRTLAQ